MSSKIVEIIQDLRDEIPKTRVISLRELGRNSTFGNVLGDVLAGRNISKVLKHRERMIDRIANNPNRVGYRNKEYIAGAREGIGRIKARLHLYDRI